MSDNERSVLDMTEYQVELEIERLRKKGNPTVGEQMRLGELFKARDIFRRLR